MHFGKAVVVESCNDKIILRLSCHLEVSSGMGKGADEFIGTSQLEVDIYNVVIGLYNRSMMLLLLFMSHL